MRDTNHIAYLKIYKQYWLKFFERPFVKRFALCCRTVVCLSVTLMYCDQTVGWIKMPLGKEVGLGPRHIVLDRTQLFPRYGAQDPHTFAVYGRGQACLRINHGPCLLWLNGWIDQDATWNGGRPRPRRHRVRCGPSSPTETDTTALPHFQPTLLRYGRPSQQLLDSCLSCESLMVRRLLR